MDIMKLTQCSAEALKDLEDIVLRNEFIEDERLPYIPELSMEARTIAVRIFKEMDEKLRKGQGGAAAHLDQYASLCLYAGIGAAWVWENDPDMLSEDNLYELLTNEGDYENLADHVLRLSGLDANPKLCYFLARTADTFYNMTLRKHADAFPEALEKGNISLLFTLLQASGAVLYKIGIGFWLGVLVPESFEAVYNKKEEEEPKPEVVYEEGDYSIEKLNDTYRIRENGELLRTPGGHIARTMYREVADGLLADWRDKGYESYTDGTSLLAYHFSCQENFAPLSIEEAFELLDGCNWHKHWTFQGCPSANPHVMMNWMAKLGNGSQNWIDYVRGWLRKCTHMQLTAAACVYNATESLNVAFYMAVCVENFDEERQEEYLTDLGNMLCMYDGFLTPECLLEVFRPFKLYYGIHVKENGNITD